MDYYLITNSATFRQCDWVQRYPFHLVLAQVLVKDPEYAAQVNQMQKTNGYQVILDNGAHESEICNLSEYLSVAKQLQPWCVVLPDLIGASAVESRTRSLVFYRWLAKQLPHLPRVMYVPQGRCLREVVDEYCFAIGYFEHVAGDILIGIGDSYKTCYLQGEGPANITAEAVKVRLVQAMLAETEVACEMHILGGRHEPTIFYSQQPNIIGIDSVDPCQCTLNNQFYPLALNVYKKATKGKFNFAGTQVANEVHLKQNVIRFCTAYGASIQ